jgi:NADPH2:quinone reductase
MARIVRFHKTGGPEVLQIENLQVPPPGKGEVQITVKALGLNRAESMFRSGQYLEEPKLPARLGRGKWCQFIYWSLGPQKMN